MVEYTLFYRAPLTHWQKLADADSQAAVEGLAGACRHIIQDGVVSDIEAVRLEQWLGSHAGILPRLGLTDLPARVSNILADWHVDEAEREELKCIVETILSAIDNPQSKPSVANLPYDDPSPLALKGKYVCVSGTFLFGKRKQVEAALAAQNARIASDVFDLTHFLLVGSAPSAGWAHGNYGRKIERAMEMKSAGGLIRIVSEEHWRRSV